MTNDRIPPSSGPNSWLIDELYQQYTEDPQSVPPEWQATFAPEGNGTAVLPVPGPVPQPESQSQPQSESQSPTRPASTGAPASLPPASQEDDTPAPEPIRGVAARIVENMESSLTVPTATSFRNVPAKLLEINRRVLNNHQKRVRRRKVSFTHLIGYAVVQAIAKTVPSMRNTFAIDDQGKPVLQRHDHVNLGIAVDMEKADGSRTLIVPVIRDADTLDFASFVAHYEELVAKVRANKISIDDITGATVTLTNPGTIGTVQSVPRLMPGQAAIIGVGSIAYPAEFEAADPRLVAQLGISKVITVTSTYDHRIIQGAESGLFLKKVHESLLGKDNFYTQVFDSMGVPYEAVQWRQDHNASDSDRSIDGVVAKQMAVSQLINQYRVRGHLIANINPLSDRTARNHPELDPATYGLTIWDLDREFLTGPADGIYAAVGGESRKMPLGDILGVLRDAYSRTVGVEYMHIANPAEKRWIQEQVEGGRPQHLERAEQHHILKRLSAAEAFEKFLAARFVGQKRFGLEGNEAVIPALDAILSSAAENEMERAVIGMAHRGRLNVLVNILGKRYRDLFDEFEGLIDESAIQGSGDVKYHLGIRGRHTSPRGATIDVELAANPSHLEAVDPVVVGMARAYMDDSAKGNYPVLPVLLHGDAAFAGQGVVSETLNLSQVHGYRVGGTIHIVINNQLGYTTAPHQSRSSEYSTDIAKAVQAPILHVNADDPEACVWVSKLAFDYRQRFNKDVVIDVIGYRRFGHNEGDDPSYTQPIMYRKIAERPPVRSLYTQALIDGGDISLEEAENALDYFQTILKGALEESRIQAPKKGIRAKPPEPALGVRPRIETGVAREMLDEIYEALSRVPEEFTIHPKLARQFETRDKMWHAGEFDWALAEAFAFGSLLAEGTSVRLAGQDSRRGTFAHRHATLLDYETGDEYTPLAALETNHSTFWVYDSTLSEYAALGFEYGYSVAKPDALVLWEAQFGDFINGAQIIIDQFLVASEDKWDQNSGLVLLLPHGYEGQGPEHSSGRMERFLLACAEDNIQVANVTTAAQLFHLLRRQIKVDASDRRPLVVFTPKSGLRSKSTRSPVSAITSGSFEEVLDDEQADVSAVRRVVFASGKLATEILAERDRRNDASVAVVRVEQLYPWPKRQVARAVDRFDQAREVVWAQEEPANMGAWNSVKGHLFEQFQNNYDVARVSRAPSGSPATGSATIHQQEQEELHDRVFGTL